MEEIAKDIRPSVLVVDDNIDNIQVIGGILKSEGLVVEFALDQIKKYLNKIEIKSRDIQDSLNYACRI